MAIANSFTEARRQALLATVVRTFQVNRGEPALFVTICDNEAASPLVVNAPMNTSLNTLDSATRTAIDAFIARLTPRFPVREAILFGSRARGDARPGSDADVAIVLHGARGPFMPTKLSMADIAFDAMLESGIRVQPLPIWDTDWREPHRWCNPELLHSIERTGIRVWQAPSP